MTPVPTFKEPMEQMTDLETTAMRDQIAILREEAAELEGDAWDGGDLEDRLTWAWTAADKRALADRLEAKMLAMVSA